MIQPELPCQATLPIITPPQPKSILTNTMKAGLSQRAQKVAQTSAGNLMWDVMRDPWCPETNPNGYVNIGVAENYLMHDHLLQYFRDDKLDLPDKYLTYNDGGQGSSRLRQAIASFLNQHLHPIHPIKFGHVVVTNGVSTAIEHISWLFADPGEGILLGRPYYGTFIPDISLRPRTTVVPVDFDEIDPFSLDGVEKYERALLSFQEKTGQKVKALMLCHPHNPLGRCYPREVLIALLRFCHKYQIHLVSDEIYALSLWQNTVDESPAPVPFESILTIDLAGIIEPSLVHVLWGMSKDFGANGLRLGAIISQSNEAVHEALNGTSIYSYASQVTDHLTSLVLEDGDFTDRYVKLNQERLAHSYAFAAKYMQRNGIEYAPGGNAGFFLWVNLGKRYQELHSGESNGDVDLDDTVMQLLLRKKVFLASGVLFGSEKPGWFRIVFSHHRDYLTEALKRIVEALEC